MVSYAVYHQLNVFLLHFPGQLICCLGLGLGLDMTRYLFDELLVNLRCLFIPSGELVSH